MQLNPWPTGIRIIHCVTDSRATFLFSPYTGFKSNRFGPTAFINVWFTESGIRGIYTAALNRFDIETGLNC